MVRIYVLTSRLDLQRVQKLSDLLEERVCVCVSVGFCTLKGQKKLKMQYCLK